MAAKLERGKPHIVLRDGYWRVQDRIQAKWRNRTARERRSVVAACTFACKLSGVWRKDVFA